MCKVCENYFGKARQVKSIHRIYKTPWQGDPRVNIQNNKGKSKSYQVKQVLKAIERLEVDHDNKKGHYTYRVTWSVKDKEYIGLCIEFPSLSWLAKTPETALNGIRETVSDVIKDIKKNGEEIPVPIANKHFSGKFMVRVPPEAHRNLALEAVVSLNRIASTKLTR